MKLWSSNQKVGLGAGLVMGAVVGAMVEEEIRHDRHEGHPHF